MTRVAVVPAEKKNTFKVMVNFIQQGVSYSSKEIADHQADIIKTRIEAFGDTVNLTK